jgi:hypothetical protein
MRRLPTFITIMFAIILVSIGAVLVFHFQLVSSRRDLINEKEKKVTAHENQPIARTTNRHEIKYVYKDNLYELPMSVIFGDKESILKWQNRFYPIYHSWVDSAGNWKPDSISIKSLATNRQYRLELVKFSYKRGNTLFNSDAGGILAIPRQIDKDNPIIIAIHGHEEPTWGKYPIQLFKENKWPSVLAKSGFVTFAPVTMYHKEIEAKVTNGYLLTWTKIISDSIDALQGTSLAIPHSGLAVAGLSAGGQISFCLMAYRKDITAGVFAGAEQPLEFMRREYRVKGHPNCWDIEQVLSYSTIQALIAPRPIMFHDGRKDPFYPDLTPFPSYPWFDGTNRDVMSDEIAGNLLVLKNIWDKVGGSIRRYVHGGGHELHGQTAADFFLNHEKVPAL